MMLIARIAIAVIGYALVISLAEAASARERPVVIGYVAAFKGIDASIAQADVTAFTHFNLAFANPDRQGRFVVGDMMRCMGDEVGNNLRVDALRTSIKRLREHGAKVLMSVAGGVIPVCSGDWEVLLTPQRRDAIVADLVALADTLGVDGIDIDIEGELLTRIDRAGDYVPFVAAMSAAMRSRDKLLTCATASYEGGMIPTGSIRYFDLINVMSYDAIGPSWGDAGDEHSTYAGAVRDLDLWLERGVPRERLVLGVPFYGYGFGGENANWSYAELVDRFGARAVRGDRIGSPCADCRYITFNGPDTIERKSDLARTKAAGVMVWEVSQDTPDHRLAKAIGQGLRIARD